MANKLTPPTGESSEKFRKRFQNFLNLTEDERVRAEKRRDYRDLKQWTTSEAAKIESRGQNPIVFDQFGKKVDGIVGLEVERRSDPKAYPVNPNDEKAAEVITDALRYVELKSDFDEMASDIFEDCLVEGCGGASVVVEKVGKEYQVKLEQYRWDRTYYDPHSRAYDFSDAAFIGTTIWMYVDDAVKLNPKREDEIRNLVGENYFEDETFEDRPRDSAGVWRDSELERIRVNHEFYLEGGVWKEVFYSGNFVIIDSEDSAYEDENGDPMCPIELESHYMDRDNNRYGYTQRLIDVQDEINHRRSKALFLLGSKTIVAEKGAFGDLSRNQVLEEFRKGMAFIEKMPNSEVEIDNQQDLGQSQVAFYQDAQNAIDSIGVNPELTGRTEGAISGRAFLARQQGGMTELARVFSRHSSWKRRIYTQIWLRIKQYWDKEKWIRVTDNENAMRFIGLNIPVTRVEKELERQSGMDIDKLREINRDQVNAFIDQEVEQDPSMGDVVETRNDVKQLDMDIVIEEAPDTAVLQQEQFDTLASLAGTRADPQMFEALIMASTIKNKEQILEKFQGNEQAQQAAQQQAQQQQELQQAMVQGELQKTQSETAKNMADVQLKGAQTKDEEASAIERITKASELPFQNNGV